MINISQVKATPKHNEECKRLLTLMGIPYINVCFGLVLLIVHTLNILVAEVITLYI